MLPCGSLYNFSGLQVHPESQHATAEGSQGHEYLPATLSGHSGSKHAAVPPAVVQAWARGLLPVHCEALTCRDSEAH